MQHTIVVTGGAGYIGSHTAFLLAQHGHKVIVIDTLSHGQTFSHPWALFIHGDCGDRALLDTVFSEHNVDAVMHFAANIEVGESVQNPLTFYQNNVVQTITLLEAMRTYGIAKFIFSSSCAVYGKPHIIPITEDHPKHPISPYGTTKYMVETILQDMSTAYGLGYVALRYFNAAGALPEYGLGERHVPESHIIPLLLRAAHTQQPFSIFGTDYPTKDGTCVRDYLHVLDIAYAHLLALHHLQEGKPSDAFNLGTGTGFSVRQIVETVEKITEAKINTVFAEKRTGDPATLVAEPAHARNILQWHPRYSDLEFIIRSAYVFEQQAPHIQEEHMLRSN